MANKDKNTDNKGNLVVISKDDLKKIITDSNKEDSLRKELETTKLGQAAGLTLGGLGAGVYGVSKHSEWLAKRGPEAAKIFNKEVIDGGKRSAKMALGLGAGVYGVSKYMHHKKKKELRRLNNENSED